MHKPDRYEMPTVVPGPSGAGCSTTSAWSSRLRALFLEPMSDAPPPIRPEQAEARQEGVTSIGHFLENLGEPAWRGVLLQWLGQYDGLEAYMYPEDDPVLAVRELLGAYVQQGRSLDPEAFSAELADLHFCYYRARRDGDRKKWEPMTESFTSFCQGVVVTVWQGAEPYPSRDLLQSSLLVRFCRAQLESRRP